MVAKALHASIDGGSVTIEARGIDEQMHASSIAVFVVDGHWYEFTASYLDFGADVADDLGVELNESYKVQGGRLRLGSATIEFPATDDVGAHSDLLNLGVWEGRRYSVHAHLYNNAAHNLLSVFEQFTIVETAHGIQMMPRRLTRTPLAKEPTLLREVRDVGLLQVMPLTRRVAETLPNWRGTKVPGGELYVGPHEEATHFVLVGPRSHTLIMRDEKDCSDDEVAQIGELKVDWQAA